MKGFILTAITNKGEKAIHYYKKNLPYKKEVLNYEPFKVEFLFTHEKEKLAIKSKDLWYIEKMLKISHNITAGQDYTIEGLE